MLHDSRDSSPVGLNAVRNKEILSSKAAALAVDLGVDILSEMIGDSIGSVEDINLAEVVTAGISSALNV